MAPEVSACGGMAVTFKEVLVQVIELRSTTSGSHNR